MSREYQKNVHNVPRLVPPDNLIIRTKQQPDSAIAALAQYDNGELSYFVQQVVRLGYVVSFTATSDGGAISIVAFDGTTRYKAYARQEGQWYTSTRDLLATLRGEA